MVFLSAVNLGSRERLKVDAKTDFFVFESPGKEVTTSRANTHRHIQWPHEEQSSLALAGEALPRYVSCE